MTTDQLSALAQAPEPQDFVSRVLFLMVADRCSYASPNWVEFPDCWRISGLIECPACGGAFCVKHLEIHDCPEAEYAARLHC